MSPVKTRGKTLTAKQAERLLEAERVVRRSRSELDAAEQELGELRSQYRMRVPLSRDDDDRKKKIRSVEIAGVKIRITPATGGASFSLKRYTEAGHRITSEMKDAINPGRTYDRWTVKALD